MDTFLAFIMPFDLTYSTCIDVLYICLFGFYWISNVVTLLDHRLLWTHPLCERRCKQRQVCLHHRGLWHVWGVLREQVTYGWVIHTSANFSNCSFWWKYRSLADIWWCYDGRLMIIWFWISTDMLYEFMTVQFLLILGTGRVPDQQINLDMKHGVEAKNYEEVCLHRFLMLNFYLPIYIICRSKF